MPAKVQVRSKVKWTAGGGIQQQLMFFTLSAGEKRTKYHPICGDIALIYIIHYPSMKKVVSCWRVPPLNGHHLHTHSHNHLYSFSIGAARGAENDPISTVCLRSLTCRLYNRNLLQPYQLGHLHLMLKKYQAPVRSKKFAKGVSLDGILIPPSYI
jgi:hypothetical protein